ncbi:MAG: VWA domain-containing protein [Candidatus Acidiferrum sp.]
MKSGWTEIRRLPFLRISSLGLSILLAFALLAISVTAQQQPAAPGNTIRLDVNRVNVGAIVTDSKGNFIEGLRRDDFQILDNGNPQSITDFAPVDAPAQVLLLLEAGPAVYLLQDLHLFVAQALLDGLSPGDRVAIAVYNNAPTAVMDYTADKRQVESALNTIQFTLGYGDLNLAASLNTVLDWLTRVPGKKSIVLVATGIDTSPPQVVQSLLPRLQAGDVRIFTISMSGPLRNGKKGTKQQLHQTQQAFAQADSWLKTLAQSAGGRAYFPENARAFQQTYRQIAELVRHEYSLAFSPPTNDGAVHQIEVTVTPPTTNPKIPPPQYTVDHRRAYVAPSPPPQ